jgi:hypothetical protein
MSSQNLDATQLAAASLTFEGYAPLAARTCSKHFNLYPEPGVVRSFFEHFRRTLAYFRNQRADVVDLTHAAFGLSGEVRELRDALASEVPDTVNALEECGDMYWYASLVYRYLLASEAGRSGWVQARQHQVVANGTSGIELALQVDHLDTLAHAYQNDVKRVLFYRKSLDVSVLIERLLRVVAALDELVFALGSTPAQVRITNITKLALRYPDSYSDLAAVSRDLGAEQRLLTTMLSRPNGNVN